MCAIFGSPRLSMVEVLYEGNKFRGNFASSMVTFMKNSASMIDDVSIHKQYGEMDINKLKLKENEHAYYMGHVQAPTSTQRSFDYDTSHPFEQEDWMVFHNGVLTNHEILNDKHCSWNESPVDTSVIVCMLQEEWASLRISKKQKTSVDEVKVIQKVIERLEGTFALSIINVTTYNVYLVRQGSTLFIDDNGSYSSIQGKGMKEVPEGYILKLTKDYKFKEVGKFESKSPFFVL